VKTLVRDEKGAALILALLLLLIGGLISAALLNHMGSGILAGEVHERRTAELYAADAGVEDAIWKLQQGEVGVCPAQPVEPPFYINANGKNVTVYIEYDVDVSMYKITSIAITSGDDGGGVAAIDSSTAVEAYVEAMTFDLLGGALVSMSDIDFSKDCVVTGDIYYVGEITGSDYTHTEGEEIQIPPSAFPNQEQNEAFAQQFEDEALLGGTHTGTMTINTDTTLGPIYITGNLDIEMGITVTLTGTIYVEGSITAKKDSAFTGSGSIVAVEDITLEKLPDYGIESDSIIMSLNGDITFKKEAAIEALVYAPNGSVNVDKQLTVEGSIIAGYINIKKDAYLTYVSKSSSFEFFPMVIYGGAIKTYNISQN
jgi:hypothetical protein